MSSSLTEISAFIKSYPIDFYLHDDEGKNVLYIDDASGVHNHSFTLEIINTSVRHIKFINCERNVSEKIYHFELRFRPGVLDINEIKLPESQDWSIIKKQQNDGIISLYILHKNQDNTLNAKGKIVLNLQQIKASPGRGARVTQVELKYANLKYQNEEETLSGNRLQSLSIINHHGRKDIPLHVGFIGGDDILNDGSPNELHLRIANTTLKEVSLKSINEVSLKSINLDVRPKFIISFDIGEADTNPWALGTESQVKSIKVEVKYPTLNTNKWEPVDISSDQNISHQWEINIPLELQQLEPGKFFEIKLSDIRTTHPLGHTNLYLRYENIPGYWDGQFVISIEKSPILYQNNKQITINSSLLFVPDNQQDIGNNTIFCSQRQQPKRLPNAIDLVRQDNDITFTEKVLIVKEFVFSIPDKAMIKGITIDVTRSLKLQPRVTFIETIQFGTQDKPDNNCTNYEDYEEEWTNTLGGNHEQSYDKVKKKLW